MTDKRHYLCQQPGTKIARGPVDKLQVNLDVVPSEYMGFPLFALAKESSGQLSTMISGARKMVGFWANRPAAFRANPIRPWYARFLIRKITLDFACLCLRFM